MTDLATTLRELCARYESLSTPEARRIVQLARVCEAAAAYGAARDAEPDWLVVEQAYDALLDALAKLKRELEA